MELTVQGLSKAFGSVRALNNVSFSAVSGRPLGLLGRNGAGKTTCMRIIMNIFDADEGCVLLDGKPLSASRIRLGYLPEERGLYRNMRVGEQLVYFAGLRGMNRTDARRSVDRWLDRLDMNDVRDKKVAALSKGNQQRIQLALALINEPEVIILDEPFSGIDPVGSLQLREIVSEVSGGGSIVLFSSHQMSAVEDICEDVVILDHGKTLISGSISELRSGYPHDTIRICAENPSAAKAIAERFGSVEVTHGGLLLRYTEPPENRLLCQLIDGDVGLTAYELVEPDLEQIFVSATLACGRKGGDDK